MKRFRGKRLHGSTMKRRSKVFGRDVHVERERQSSSVSGFVTDTKHDKGDRDGGETSTISSPTHATARVDEHAATGKGLQGYRQLLPRKLAERRAGHLQQTVRSNVVVWFCFTVCIDKRTSRTVRPAQPHHWGT